MRDVAGVVDSGGLDLVWSGLDHCSGDNTAALAA